MGVRKRIGEITTALQGRQLVYFGTRGADAEPLLMIPNFKAVFSLIAPLQASTVEETCLEILTRDRVELDDYSIDFDQRPVVSEIRRKLLRVLERPSALLTYRPCAFLSSVWFPRSDRVKYLGLFHGHQACFEHKAWVETQLADANVPVLSWRFFADEEREIIKEWAEVEPIVLRSNRTDGGIGVRFVQESKTLEAQWPSHNDGFIAVTPFLEESMSLNLNACVYKDGTVTFHGPSVQLIGIPSLTSRRFGYCGNDFAAAKTVDSIIWDELEQITISTAGWLHRQGYLGAFGVDALVHNGRVYLTEVNPRFQGSSLLSARLDALLDRPNVFIEHIAAFLGLETPEFSHLRDLVISQAPLSHAVAHNTSNSPVKLKYAKTNDFDVQCRLLPEDDIRIPIDGITFDLVFSKMITSNGRELTPDATTIIDSLITQFKY